MARPHGGAVLGDVERVKGCGGGTSLGEALSAWMFDTGTKQERVRFDTFWF